jgi:serine/threonine protein kinase
MDPTHMFPKGFHGAFNLDVRHRASERRVKRLTRLQVPVKYYLIDFGSSAMFPSFEERQPVEFTAAVWVPPEVEKDPDALYDSFKGDIYSLGITLLAEIRVS